MAVVYPPEVPIPQAVSGGEIMAEAAFNDRGAALIVTAVEALFFGKQGTLIADALSSEARAFTPDDPMALYLPSGLVERRWRFKTPIFQNLSPNPTYTIWLDVVRSSASPSSTWTLDVHIEGLAAGTYSVPFTGGSRQRVALVSNLAFPDNVENQELRLTLNTYSGDLETNEDMVFGVYVIPTTPASSSSMPKTLRSVQGLSPFMVRDDEGASTWQLRWAHDLLREMYRRRVQTFHTSTGIIEHSLTEGIDDELRPWTITRLQPLAGVQTVTLWVYCLRKTIDSRVGLAGPNGSQDAASPKDNPGWLSFTADITGSLAPTLRPLILHSYIFSACMYAENAVL